MEEKTEIVLGPPGTGKTTTLLGYLDDELAGGTPPDRIGYVSFTRRAADEAITRACKQFNRERSDFPYFRTLHSMCFKMLGLTGSDVLEGQRMQEFANYAGVRITGRWSEDGSLTGFDLGDRIIFMENLARVRRVTIREQYDLDSDGLPWSIVDRVTRALREFKQDRGLLDYTDMLLEFVRSGNPPRLDVLFVDEAQDLSAAQWEVVRVLAQRARRVVIAGDDDQAIYRWAGADVDFFVQLRGKVRVLEQSWRVPRLIQELAEQPLGAVLNRREKHWRSREADGAVHFASKFIDVNLDGQDILVLARNDYVLREHVEPELRIKGIIYEKHGFPSVKTSLMEAISSWEKLRAGGSVSGAEARDIYRYMKTREQVAHGFKTLNNVSDEDEVTLDYLKKHGGLLTDDIWHKALTQAPQSDIRYILAARERGERLRARPRVRLSTIHGSKGGQADHVVLFKEMASRTYREMRFNPEDEARVWYVGITRAKEEITVVEARTNQVCPWI